MGSFLRDLRYGVRTLANNPGFTVVAVAVLAVGIGANIAIFSVANSVLLKPLPYKDPERLVMVYERLERSGRTLSEALDVAEARRIYLSEEWTHPFSLP